jgi:hypothetical protein
MVLPHKQTFDTAAQFTADANERLAKIIRPDPSEYANAEGDKPRPKDGKSGQWSINEAVIEGGRDRPQTAGEARDGNHSGNEGDEPYEEIGNKNEDDGGDGQGEP